MLRITIGKRLPAYATFASSFAANERLTAILGQTFANDGQETEFLGYRSETAARRQRREGIVRRQQPADAVGDLSLANNHLLTASAGRCSETTTRRRDLLTFAKELFTRRSGIEAVV